MKISRKNSQIYVKNCFFIFLSLPSFLCFYYSQAQYTSGQDDFWNQVRYGGGIGLGFTNGGFNGAISPSAIYPISDTFAAGLSLNINYAKFNKDKFLAYGGNLLSLYNQSRSYNYRRNWSNYVSTGLLI
ncbi:MAG: hypothetical protein ACJAWH_001612 [Maribacter sp.]|jgi:hypothetical protein